MTVLAADLPTEAPAPAPADEPRFRKLRELGLTEYQAKAYLALLRLGKGTAAQVAKVAEVPRNKLYPVMQQLNHLGIVETLLGEAQVFRALPLDRYLAERLGALLDEARALDHSREGVAAMFRAPEEDPGLPAAGYRLFHGRANTVEQARLALRGARVEVHLLGSAGTPARMLASGEAEVLRERLEDGVRARLVVARTEANRDAFAELEEALGAPLAAAGGPFPEGMALAIDGALALQAQLQPDDASPSRGHDVCLVSASPILARLVAHHALATAPEPPAERAAGPQPA